MTDHSNLSLRRVEDVATESEEDLAPSVEFTDMSRRRILWNLIALCFNYFLLYTGFYALTGLESTMNTMEGIGPISQAVVYAVSMLSCIALPEVLIESFGCKKVILWTSLISIPFIAANIKLRWDSLMTTAVLFGLGAGPYNAALTVYVDEISFRYGGDDMEFVMSCFYGVFSFFMENTNIWGNMVSFLILRPPHRHGHWNVTADICGIDFKPGNSSNPNLIPPTDRERVLLVGVYTAMAVTAVVVAGFSLDPLLNDVKGPGEKMSVWKRALASFKQFLNPHQLLLVPLSVFIGMESAFYSNEVTEAYIACSWGVHHVGFVTICFGVCGAIMALAVGPLVKCISQLAVLVLAAGANLACCILLFFWQPSPDAPYAYFLFAGVWGMGDAIWWSQLAALYGLMFPNDREAAFSNLYFWSFLGFFLSYSYANYLTVAAKLNILLVFLITGIVGFLIGQFKIKCSPRNEYIVLDQEES